MAATSAKTTSRGEAVGLLTPALGEELASSTIAVAATALGFPPDEWSAAQFRALFAHVALEEGLVGITARVVARRLRSSSGAHPIATGHASTMGTPAPRALETARKPLDAIAHLLEQALGAEMAAREVEKASRALGFGDHVDFGQSLKILQRMAHEPGLVGIAAQFAKTRLHLLTW